MCGRMGERGGQHSNETRSQSLNYSPTDGRTPENHPKTTCRNPVKILTFEAHVCANPGKFECFFEGMSVHNPGKSPGSARLYVNPVYHFEPYRTRTTFFRRLVFAYSSTICAKFLVVKITPAL